MISTIAIDFGGVLFPIQPYLHKPTPKQLHVIKQVVIDIYTQHQKEIDEKRFSPAHFKNALSDYAHVCEVDLVYESITTINKELYTVIMQLNTQFTIVAAVNEAPLWTELRRYFHNLDSVFSGYFVSSVVGLEKPDPDFFLQLVTTLGIKPAELLFIDDSGGNVAVANKLGINALVYTGFVQVSEICKIALNEPEMPKKQVT